MEINADKKYFILYIKSRLKKIILLKVKGGSWNGWKKELIVARL